MNRIICVLIDVDECAGNSTLCGDLQCANIPGSFQCLGKCDVGLKRTMDDKECVGKIYFLYFCIAYSIAIMRCSCSKV